MSKYRNVYLNLILIEITVLFGTNSIIWATTNPLSVQSIDSIKPIQKNGTDEKSNKTTDEADQMITNRQLRASSGSLSQWSMNTYWSYSAGSINNPFDVVRPNITAAGDTTVLQSLYGTIGIRHRMNTQNSLGLSMGLNMISPFHFSISTYDSALKNEFDQNARKVSINNPTLIFKHLNKFKSVQSISSVSFNLYTAEFTRNNGFRTGFVLNQNLMYELGKTGLSAGGVIEATFNTFGGDVDSSRRPAFILGLYPVAEYSVNDHLNIRTLLGLWVNEFRRNGDSFTRVVYQSVGLGISVARDVFLYPNVQFLPKDLRANKTNLGISANINLF